MTKAIAGLALLGLAISAYLTWVHYAGIEPVCTGVSDCERVQNSSYAELVGIPVAVLGVVGYTAILASLKTRVEITAMLAYVAVVFSAYLTWAEVFRIEAIPERPADMRVGQPVSIALQPSGASHARR